MAHDYKAALAHLDYRANSANFRYEWPTPQGLAVAFLAVHEATIRAALELAAKVQAGDLVLVPREPSEEMLLATKPLWGVGNDGQPLYGNKYGMKNAYQTMIAKAQEGR